MTQAPVPEAAEGVAVTAVVLAYGDEPVLDECVEAILASVAVHVRVVLVDNGCTSDAVSRLGEINRTTKETDVALRLALDGSGLGQRSTGVGFLDHMLDLLARHGRLDLEVKVTGDLQTGAHHTVEDTGIVFGQALDEALGERRGIARYGQAIVPMDEARALCAIDISGRPFAAISGFERLPAGDIAASFSPGERRARRADSPRAPPPGPSRPCPTIRRRRRASPAASKA